MSLLFWYQKTHFENSMITIAGGTNISIFAPRITGKEVRVAVAEGHVRSFWIKRSNSGN